MPTACAADPLVLQVGRLEVKKAPEDTLSAVALLREEVPGLRVRFVGTSCTRPDGADGRAFLAARARRLGVTVEFSDHVGRDSLTAQYADARVVVVPSRHESFSMVAAEAIASGRPVVVSDGTGISEQLDGSGFRGTTLTPVGDVQAIARALRPWLEDPGAAVTAGRAAREQARDLFAPEHAALARLAIYAAVGSR